METYGIVVGISTKWLHGADNDARLALKLFKQAGVRNQNIRSFINTKTNVEDIWSAYAWLRGTCTSEDRVLIVYCGEGIGSLGLYNFNILAPTNYSRMLLLIHECYSSRYISFLGTDNRRLIITSATNVAADGKPYTVWGRLFLMNWFKNSDLSVQAIYEMSGLGDIWPASGSEPFYL